MSETMMQTVAIRASIFGEIVEERRRQDEKFGADRNDRNETNVDMLPVLVEEVGEIAKELNERGHRDTPHLEAELVQVAATAVAWLEMIAKRRGAGVSA
jgi:NTP pyrophosphatase (non-canonical NTP hydrolase)